MVRVTSGINGLDPLLDGGFPEGTVVLVSGGPGAGKTLFGLSFLVMGAGEGDKGCMVTFNEAERDVLRACGNIRSLESVEELKERNILIRAIELGRDTSVADFIDTVERYPRFDRLVIDNLNKLLMFSENQRDYRLQLSALVRFLRKRVGCSILICETDDGKLDTGNGEAFEVDGVMTLSYLEFEEKPTRILRIEKMRYTSIEPRVAHEYIIDEVGLRIGEVEVI
jgi:KaiC/GvpD/RAD55 family RecA-like ATPase